MNVKENFESFINNLKIDIDKANNISYKYKRITKNLNKAFRDTESDISNRLQVGSYGRFTGIKSISDLDMLYIMPNDKWDNYNIKNGQRKLLEDTKEAIKNTFSSSVVSIDRCVVSVNFSDFHIDIQPVFETEDKDYKYPDTYGDGKWKITKPRKEISAMREFSDKKNSNLRNLCRMARAWRNKNGVLMGGLLIDTLAYNFLNSTFDFDNKSYGCYDEMSKEFFLYLYELPRNQKEYSALGSNQRVKVRKAFKSKAKKAYELAIEAIDEEKEKKKHGKWRDIYGNDFPKYQNEENDARALNESFKNTEEFIYDQYPIDIQYDLKIDCEISQNGFRKDLLRKFLSKNNPLLRNKKLKFFIERIDVTPPYSIRWKITNRGEEAIRRNCIRGQIIKGNDDGIRNESTDFKGEHFVECYIIKNETVVAIDRIDVPISN